MPPEPPQPFPEGLERIREAAGHHLVLLALLARADADESEVERQVIVEHCLNFAHRAGAAPSAPQREMLVAYVREFHPSLMQLDPALKKLAHDSKDDIAALLAAAQAVVDADGVRRPAEVKFLAELQQDLARL